MNVGDPVSKLPHGMYAEWGHFEHNPHHRFLYIRGRNRMAVWAIDPGNGVSGWRIEHYLNGWNSTYNDMEGYATFEEAFQAFYNFVVFVPELCRRD